MQKIRSLSIWRWLAAIWLLIFLVSCAAIPDSKPSAERETKVQKITKDLSALGPHVDHKEAYRIANTVVYYPLELAKKYELTKPPLIHNMLVNMGSKPRGLCYHWATDILLELKKQNPQSFDLYWAIANKGSRAREHSSVVVTARGQDFYQGLVFDGWRKSGNLYWTKLKKDPKYKWHPHLKKH